MNKKIFNALIILFSSIFLITIVSTCALLYSDYKIGATSAENRFEKLFNQTENAIVKYSYPNTDFLNSFNNAIGSITYYNSVTLQSSNITVYDYKEIDPELSKIFTITKSRRLTQGDKIDLTLTASIYTLSSEIIFSRIKVAFMIILITTILSALCLIYLYLNDSDKNENSPIKEKNSNEEDLSFEENFDENEIFINDDIDKNLNILEEDSFEENIFSNDEDEDIFATKKLDEENILPDEVNQVIEDFDIDNELSEQENNFDEIQQEANNNEKSKTIESKNLAVQNNLEENFENENFQKDEDENDLEEKKFENNLNIFSEENSIDSTTGFCYEKFLSTRLESELEKASSGDFDLSLMIISIPEINIEDDCGIQICKRVLEIFQFNNMIFRYKENGIAVILSNSDIDKTMENAESIYLEISSLLAKNEISSRPFFGIAARSLRFISGDRLITEAEQALEHAKNDADNPIIAFRVNPEKYRQYISSLSQKENGEN